MLRRTVLSVPLVALTVASWTAFAQGQDAPKPAEAVKFYRLDFVFKEVEGGKVLNTRTYSATASSDPNRSSTQIRASGRFPYQTATGDAKASQFAYYDVGVSVDCRAGQESERGLSLQVQADISSVPTDAGAPALGPPTIRQNRWTSMTIVPLKKPTLIFSSDDPTSKRQMQLEVTATPIN